MSSITFRWFAGILPVLLAFSSATRAEPVQLTLPYCLETAVEFNRELVQAREAIRQQEGNRIVVRSRFQPHVDLTANYDAERTGIEGRTDDQIASSLRFSQRLFEYGPDFTEEVQMRSQLRQAVYDYEGKVYSTLASVWETFHLILLQDQQIAIRRQSRDNFQAAYQRQLERFKSQLATENDVLNAQLSVLSDSLAINNLQRDQFSNKMKLLRLIGQPIGTEIRLQGKEVTFSIDQDRAVELALHNSVQVALSMESLREQERVVREIDWEYSPDISLNAGVQDGRRNAQVELGKRNQTWGLDISSEYALREVQAPEFRDQARWFTQLEARIPIFEGSSRLGREMLERARLRQNQMQLRDLRSSVELQVRQAFQSVLEAEGRQLIQAERVRIEGRRLEINQILKDKGQADENLLETVRKQFFAEQDRLFSDQATYIQRIAALRRQMGFFE
jgi:outer membrane protein TolC